ncbi:MAG: hypothetical protein JWQ33_2214, partial [Ramlibacter sp.]|nr:hypothetical protein [Ramlibacter sp.]
GLLLASVTQAAVPKTPALAIRCEDLRLGAQAAGLPIQLRATLEEIVYKGTTVDHCLRLEDGQQVVATATSRQAQTPGEALVVGVNPERVVMLED